MLPEHRPGVNGILLIQRLIKSVEGIIGAVDHTHHAVIYLKRQAVGTRQVANTSKMAADGLHIVLVDGVGTCLELAVFPPPVQGIYKFKVDARGGGGVGGEDILAEILDVGSK